MSQINSNTKDDFQVVLLLSCFVGHPVSRRFLIEKYSESYNIDHSFKVTKKVSPGKKVEK